MYDRKKFVRPKMSRMCLFFVVYALVQLGEVPRTLDPAECRGRASSARRRDEGDDEVTDAGLCLSIAIILPRWNLVEGGHRTCTTKKRHIRDILGRMNFFSVIHMTLL